MFITIEGPDGSGKTTQVTPLSDYLTQKGHKAARAQLVDQIIKPHLKEGYIVLCDRYADSTMAYQGYGHQNDLDEINILINFATGGLKPDLTILLDVDAERGLQRKVLGSEWNRLDAYSLEFHQRVRQGYHLMAAAEPDRWVTIDAGQPPEQVQVVLQQVVSERLVNTGKL